MKRTAVFVDAGYLYAQGSACLKGSKVKRESLKLDHAKMIARLKFVAATVQPNASLLRIYWYDGTSRGPTQDHRLLAELDDLKLRLGYINSVGQQKGVDSLLVTDLVELARNGAIADAVLLGGDEDLRIGVQIAQSFGVRVHLIGIEPSRGSQSAQLRQEADTKHEILASEIQFLLQVMEPVPPVVINPPVSVSPSVISPAALILTPTNEVAQFNQAIDQGIEAVIATLKHDDVVSIDKMLLGSQSVPALYDRRVLASCRTALGRDLLMDEKKAMRVRFIARIRALAANATSPIP